MKYDAAEMMGEVDRAQRLTPSDAGVHQELVELGERDVVQGWMRELNPRSGHQIFVNREWGTVSAVPDGETVRVFWTDGRSTWQAVPPGAADDEDLTPQQIEQIILDATSSTGPPQWPDWSPLWGPATWEARRRRVAAHLGALDAVLALVLLVTALFVGAGVPPILVYSFQDRGDASPERRPNPTPDDQAE